MPTLASQVISKARTQSIDVGATRFADADWIGFLNDALRATVEVYPHALTKTATVQLAAGAKQSLPADGLQLIEVTRNMGGGNTPGSAPRVVSRRQLDVLTPLWPRSAQNATVSGYMLDAEPTTTYYVTPPNTGAGFVEISYAAMPATITVAGDAVPLPDIYINALVSFMLHKAYDVDSEVVGNAERALIYKKAHADSVMSIAAAQGYTAAKAASKG